MRRSLARSLTHLRVGRLHDRPTRRHHRRQIAVAGMPLQPLCFILGVCPVAVTVVEIHRLQHGFALRDSSLCAELMIVN